MIRQDRVAYVLAGAAALSTAALLLVAADAAPAVSPATLPAERPVNAPAFAAMTYYDNDCAKCHGPEGASYGPSLGRHLDDAGLIKACADMAAGPSQDPIQGRDLDTETAFHRALIMGNPYLSVTAIDGDKWSGEVMVDAKVTIHVGGREISADVSDWNWTATLPAGTRPGDVTITAEVDGRTTTLHPAQAMYSNTDPIPPPEKRNHPHEAGGGSGGKKQGARDKPTPSEHP
ncbi:MAG: hypothetical protein ACTHN5_04575 [Phycisphaerae bacterium]